MASGVYNNFKMELMNGSYNLGAAGDVIKVALMDNIHAYNADNDVWTDVSANELATAGGYTSPGQNLAGQTVSVDDTDDEGVLDGTDIQWTSATFSAYHAVLYDDTVTDDLILSIDFGGIQTVTSGTFTIQWATEGILNLT